MLRRLRMHRRRRLLQMAIVLCLLVLAGGRWTDRHAGVHRFGLPSLRTYAADQRIPTIVLTNRPPCSWGRGYRNSIPGLVPGLVDSNATYWAYGYDLTPENTQKTIRFSGQFPYARYMSLIAYDEQGSTVAQLFDQEITPLPGSENPYQPGIDRATPQRSFEAWLVPEGSSRVGQPNTLVIPSRVQTLVLLLRVYLPDTGRDIAGGVALPTIEAFDAEGKEQVSCPAFRYPLPGGSFTRVDTAPFLQGTQVAAYRITGDQYQPNGTNPYLAAPLPATPNTVAVLRYRVPTTPRTLAGGGSFSGAEQARYWSICLGDLAGSTTSACLFDEQVPVSADGWVTLVVGPARLASVVAERGGAFLPLGAERKPVLLFRQILPASSYAYPFNLVPPIDLANPPAPAQLEQLQAVRYLGDYAPQGHVYSERVWQESSALMPGQGASFRVLLPAITR